MKLDPLIRRGVTRAPGVALIVLLSGSCAAPVDQYEPVADVKDLMLSVLEPAAMIYWDGVGEVLDERGVHEIRPQSDEDWVALRNAALVIAETGNLLMMTGRARDQGEWATHAKAMIETGRVALRAADARNAEAVFDAGAEVYYACSACHAMYATETLRPNDTRGVSDDRIAAPDTASDR